jgi:GNAT superfamily N-acetyltransferase
MCLKYEIVFEADKEELYEYVRNNIQDPILRTFLTLWDERDYWDYNPIVVYDEKIVGFIAYSNPAHYKDCLKVYYLHVLDEYRGNGIAKQLLNIVYDASKFLDKYFLFISEENSDGFKLFKAKFDYNMVTNEFGTNDFVFKIPSTHDKLL